MFLTVKIILLKPILSVLRRLCHWFLCHWFIIHQTNYRICSCQHTGIENAGSRFLQWQKALARKHVGGDRATRWISNIKIQGSRDVEHFFQILLNMLKHSQGKIDLVSLHGIQDISPEMLAIIYWIASRTSGLAVFDCNLGDSGFACLMSGFSNRTDWRSSSWRISWS